MPPPLPLAAPAAGVLVQQLGTPTNTPAQPLSVRHHQGGGWGTTNSGGGRGIGGPQRLLGIQQQEGGGQLQGAGMVCVSCY